VRERKRKKGNKEKEGGKRERKNERERELLNPFSYFLEYIVDNYLHYLVIFFYKNSSTFLRIIDKSYQL